MAFVIKVFVTALVVVGASELAKKSVVWGALLAALPLTSILALIWLYRDTQSIERVSNFSQGVFWAVIPSLAFFLIFPALLKMGLRFEWALIAASLLTTAVYALFGWAVRGLGVQTLG